MPDWLNGNFLAGALMIGGVLLVKLWPTIQASMKRVAAGKSLNPRHLAVQMIIAVISSIGKDQRVIDILDETVQKLSELEDPLPEPIPVTPLITAAQLQAAAEILNRGKAAAAGA